MVAFYQPKKIKNSGSMISSTKYSSSIEKIEQITRKKRKFEKNNRPKSRPKTRHHSPMEIPNRNGMVRTIANRKLPTDYTSEKGISNKIFANKFREIIYFEGKKKGHRYTIKNR